MERPRIRHIALNVKDRDVEAEFYKANFGMEEKLRGSNGTIYLSDGFVDLAIISDEGLDFGIHHFGFVVNSVEAIEESADTKANANTFGAVAESWITDPEGIRVDVAETSWPV